MNLFAKSSLRAPLLYLFLLLVIGVVSYGFVGKAVEYVIVQRETSRLEGYYRAIGEVETVQELGQESYQAGIEMLRTSPELSLFDQRRFSSGVMEGIYNHDFHPGTSESNFYKVNNRGVNNLEYWFLGTVLNSGDYTLRNEKDEWEVVGYEMAVEVDRVLAAYPEKVQAGGRYGIYISLAHAPNAEASVASLKSMTVGQRYLMRAYIDPGMIHRGNTAGIDIPNQLWQVKPLDGKDLYYLAVPQGQEAILEDPKYAFVQENLELLNHNLHALYIVSTRDMSAMPEMQESRSNFYLMEGRWLNQFDNAQRNCGIVISEDLAQTRGIALGDEITLRLRSLPDPYYGYLRSKDLGQWQGGEEQAERFEVVGLYSNSEIDLKMQGQHKIEATRAFIPDACLNEGAAYAIGTQAAETVEHPYSFILGDARAQESFRTSYNEKLKDYGLAVSFVNNNAANFLTSADPARRSATSGLVLLSAVLVVAIGLAAFLYLRQHLRNFALSRALGLPAKDGERQMLIPYLFLAACGSLVGAGFAWNYALGKAVETLSTLATPAGVQPEPGLGIAWLVVLWLGVFALLVAALVLGLRRLRKLSVLNLLQEGTRENKAVDAGIGPLTEGLVFDAHNKFAEVYPPEEASGKLSKRALAIFARRQSSRMLIKSLLALILALGFVLALGWLRANMLANQAEVERLYATTEVRAEVKAGLPPMVNADGSLAESSEGVAWSPLTSKPISRLMKEQLEESPYIEKVYVDAIFQLRSIDPKDPDNPYRIKRVPAHGAFVTNDLSTAQLGVLKGTTLQFLPGYDASIFSKQWTEADIKDRAAPVIMPEDLLAYNELAPGQEVTWVSEAGAKFTVFIAGSYSGGSSNWMAVQGAVDPKSGELLVAYRFHYMLMPLGIHELIIGQLPRYMHASFYLDSAYYRDLDFVKKELNAILAEPGMSITPAHLKFWDEELTAALLPLEKNLSLLGVLYPVTLAVSVLIGFGLSLGLVLQQARESALLRMLGVGAVPLRLLLSGTQLLLALAGVLVGLGLLALLRGPAGLGPQAFGAAGLYLAGVLLGTLLGATLVSRRKPMELLQVKE